MLHAMISCYAQHVIISDIIILYFVRGVALYGADA